MYFSFSFLASRDRHLCSGSPLRRRRVKETSWVKQPLGADDRTIDSTTNVAFERFVLAPLSFSGESTRLSAWARTFLVVYLVTMDSPVQFGKFQLILARREKITLYSLLTDAQYSRRYRTFASN